MWHYEVTVWDVTDGSVEKYFSDVTEDELEGIRESYSDDPFLEVVIDKEWEESNADD